MAKIFNNRTELLALPSFNRKSIAQAIPKPKHELPEHCPAGWESAPLHQKLPMDKSLLHQLVLSRKKLSEDLYKKDVGEFDLSDPYMHKIIYKYEPLHDPALKTYFKQPQMFRLLLDRGKIGLSGAVYCSLKDYNDYRQFLNTVHLVNVKNVRSFKEANAVDFRKIKNAMNKSAINDSNFYREEFLTNAKNKRNEQYLNAKTRRLDNLRKSNIRSEATMKRATDIVAQKAAQIHEVLAKRRMKNELQKFKINEKFENRKLMANINSSMKSKLAKARIQQFRLQSLAQRNYRQTCFRNKQYEWRIEHGKYIEALVALNEEVRNQNIENRIRSVNETREHCEQQIREKSANILRKSYEKATVENLIGRMMREIKKMFHKEYLRKTSKLAKGLDDTITVFEILNRKTVSQVVRSVYGTVLLMRVPGLTSAIIKESVKILRRIALSRSTKKLPKDAQSFNFIRTKVKAIMDEVKMVAAANLILRKSKDNTKESSKELGTSLSKKSVKFHEGGTFIPLNNDDSSIDILKNVHDRSPSPINSLSNMIKIELESIQRGIEFQLPEEMKVNAMIQFNEYQKLTVHHNLSRLKHYLIARTEKNCNKHRTLGKKNVRVFTKNEKDEVLDSIVTSMLTLPEADTNFGNAVLSGSELIWSEIIYNKLPSLPNE